MIIVDFSPIAIAAITQQVGRNGLFSGANKFEEGLVRHVVLNSLRANIKRFKSTEFGPEIIITFDSFSGNYWRKQIFPHYKAHRKAAQDKSYIDWQELFKILNKIRVEFKECLPYKCLEVATAEADDIIATLILNGDNTGNYMILSGDHDFCQLHQSGPDFSWEEGKHVKQWSPKEKKFISVPDSAVYLKEHIIRGDKGDGIPNILSDDDAFADPDKRQITMTQERFEKYNTLSLDKYNEKELRGFKRNESLIDLRKIPEAIQETILHDYKNTTKNTKAKFLDYMITKGMKHLIEDISDF
jgi:hypothetical protein